MADHLDKLLAQIDELQSDRRTWEAHWQDVATLVLPQRDFTTMRAAGEKRDTQIYDATAVWANGQLAAGLHSFLTNPVVKWFALRVQDPSIDQRDDVRAWMLDTRDRMFRTFSSVTGDFQSQAHELYLDISAFGTSCMFTSEQQRAIRFRTHPLNECYVREDQFGRVDTLVREWTWTLRQVVQRFGTDVLPDDLKGKVETKPATPVQVIHIVAPRGDQLVAELEKGTKKWVSVYITRKPKAVLSVGGFNVFPYVVPRWTKMAGEVYGRSQAMTVLPDIRMLQEMNRTVLRSAQKQVDPPIQMPDEGFLGPLRLASGGINFYRASSQGRIETIKTEGRIDIGIELIKQRQDNIIRAFFVDLLLLREGPQMTATEVLARREEKLRLMSPMISRVQNEFLGPLIRRVYKLMAAVGMFLPPPPDLAGRKIEVDYVSAAALSQQTSEVENIQRWFNAIIPFIELDPRGGQNVSVDEIIRTTATLYNIAPSLLVSIEAVTEQRQADAEKAQAAEQLQQGQGIAEGAAKTAKAIRDLSQATA